RLMTKGALLYASPEAPPRLECGRVSRTVPLLKPEEAARAWTGLAPTARVADGPRAQARGGVEGMGGAAPRGVVRRRDGHPWPHVLILPVPAEFPKAHVASSSSTPGYRCASSPACASVS